MTSSDSKSLKTLVLPRQVDDIISDLIEMDLSEGTVMIPFNGLLLEDLRVKDLTDKQVVTIRNVISELNLLIEGEGRTQVSMNIKRKRDIGCYQGLRHRRSLPVNGQRTKTNSRTRKGKRRTIGLGKKG